MSWDPLKSEIVSPTWPGLCRSEDLGVLSLEHGKERPSVDMKTDYLQ